ncbi:MAG: DMT family transporter [Rubellimicrobium sp.]|nr:DMT family transporter [Rubellimicrobium sp.]
MSTNDLAIKHLSDVYPLHEVVLVRSLVGLCVLGILMWWTGGGLHLMRTGKPGLHLARTGLILLSNITYFAALAALPLADAVAISFVAPLFVTVLSIPLLRERVGRHRWIAVGVGLIGTMVMVRPGAGTISPMALLALFSALTYAGANITVRLMRGTESAVTMSFFVQIGFIVASGLMWLVAGDGRFAQTGSPSIDFLLRAWVMPPPADWPWFIVTGLAIGIGGLMVTQAYRLSEAALVAPFEYAAIPFAILWGVVFFAQWPDATAWTGIALICGAGLYVLWRETVRRRRDDATEGSGL